MVVSCGLLLAWVVTVRCALGAPSWPIMYSYAPDSLPIIQVRLAPPRKPLPEVSALSSKLDADRAQFEAAQMLEVEAAYNASLKAAAEELPALIDRLMRSFEKPAGSTMRRKRGEDHGSGKALSFNEVRDKPGGHELTARINVLPTSSPDPSLERKVQEIEDKRTRDEGKLFQQALSEMEGLVTIVKSELEAQLTQQVSNMLRTMRFGSVGSSSPSLARSASLLSGRQPALASGLQLTTNVRIGASDEPFPTIASMVEDLERSRDASESLARTRILEMDLNLLKAANQLVSDRLQSWVEYILKASP